MSKTGGAGRRRRRRCPQPQRFSNISGRFKRFYRRFIAPPVAV